MIESLAPQQPFAIEVKPRLEDYALRPIEQAFDVPGILDEIGISGAYCVEFDSLRRSTAEEDLLRAIDDEAHLEAAGASGFILYFQGEPDPNGRTKSFCLWRSIEEGKAASKLPAHRKASAMAGLFYDSALLRRRAVYLNPGSQYGVGFFEVDPPVSMNFN